MGKPSRKSIKSITHTLIIRINENKLNKLVDIPSQQDAESKIKKMDRKVVKSDIRFMTAPDYIEDVKVNEKK